MRVELEIGDDLRAEQAYGVARSGIAKSGMEFFGDSRAADNMTPLQYANFKTAGGKVTCAHQTIVAATDDDRVKHGASPDRGLAMARLQAYGGRGNFLVTMSTSTTKMTLGNGKMARLQSGYFIRIQCNLH